MNETNTIVMEDDDIIISYEEFADDIATVLELGFHLPPEQAKEVVRIASLRSVFEFDPEMALHTSYDDWAEIALTRWKRHQA